MEDFPHAVLWELLLPNTGEMYLLEGKNGKIAHTTILYDANHPSAILLPGR